MIFRSTSLVGVFVIEPERLDDERGFFARTFCANEFAVRGLNSRLNQCSISFNRLAGTVRGMHYQAAPNAEVKLVRCTMGAIYDVVLDLRRESASYKSWVAVELSAQNRSLLYIPEGVAHGFQTLVDNTEVAYQISTPHQPDSARGLRWNDRSFGISWPMPLSAISPRDAGYPLWVSPGEEI